MEEEKTCESCRHFYRHYVRVGGNRYVPIDFGHCVEPRFKDRKTQTPACQRYSKKPTKGKGEEERPPAAFPSGEGGPKGRMRGAAEG